MTLIAVCPRCQNHFNIQDKPVKKSATLAFRIIEIVCDHFTVSEDDLSSRSRLRVKVAARHCVMYLIYQHCGYGVTTIGGLFQRDHTTVLHAKTRIQNSMDTKADLYESIIHLEGIIRGLTEQKLKLA